MAERKRPLDGDEEFESVTEDLGSDEDDLVDVEKRADTKLKQLREKLKACEEEKRTHLEDVQRTKADFLNTRKRLEEQLKRDTERVTERHIIELLPLADSFAIAMESPDWEKCDETWRKGIEGIHSQLQQILTRHGVTVVRETGVPFDPHLHDAVANEPVEDDSKVDTVVRVLQAGYRKGDAVLRHAKVAVGHKE